MSVIWLQSAYAGPPADVLARSEVRVIPQHTLTADDLAQASGLITGNQLDQNALLAVTPALELFLDRGGRWFFSGHVMRPLIAGLSAYEPMVAPKRADFLQTRLHPHPVFEGIALAHLETNKGVGGFYGRGANPMPAGGVAITGLRGGLVLVDWVWKRPAGGRFFSHAGNDLGSMGQDWGLAPLLRARMIEWAAGGLCL